MTSGINNYKSAVSTSPTNPASLANQATTATPPKKTGSLTDSTISQDQFLNLLVHQLQNQDPLNPMDNQEFAVQLAQFSQLEQMVQINEKVGGSAAGGASSMAAYLGNEVAFTDNQVRVAANKGSNLVVDIPAGTQSIRVDLENQEGVTVKSINFEGEILAGQQVLALESLDLPDGKYNPRVVSVGDNGRFANLNAKATGTVSGFVMEPEPKLLVGGEEVAIAEVGAVYKGN